jgi:hypothetical protein
MTHRLRMILPGLALALLTGAGCVLISGQFLVELDVGDVSVNSASNVTGYFVDLATNGTYKDHKNDVKSLEDIALLGSVHNTGSSSLTLAVYLRDGNPGALPAGTVTSTGIRVWGPLTIAAGATEKLDWDRSSALFGSGKSALFTRVKSGDPFTLYAVGSTAPFTFDIKDGVLLVVIGAGK